MSDFAYGFFYPFRCIPLFFRKPKLILFSIVPVLINLLIYGTIFYFVFSWIYNTSSNITGANNPDALFYQELLHILVLFTTVILLLVICYFFFITIGGIISAPFNELLSVIVEEELTKIKVVNPRGFFADSWMSIKAEVVKLGFYLSISIPLFLLNFIPIVGFIFDILNIIFSSFYNALDFLDIPMTRREIKLRQKIKITNSGGMLSYGFGAIAFIIMFVPVINVLLKPLLVVSGTSLFFEKDYLKFYK
ncbi:MAG TPA: EI24 domain-containing protein [Ignavibacteria bacterium]|nr:EI24 domain-containing protein [Ignavibacteria bacterium]